MQSYKKLICLFFSLLLSIMVSGQSWNGTWKTNIGEIPITESRAKLLAKFTINSQNTSEEATLIATVNGNKANGTIKTASGSTMYFRWTLVDNQNITGHSAWDKSKLDSSFGSLKFNATRIKESTNPKKNDFIKRGKVKKQKNLEVVLTDQQQSKLDKFNRRLDDSKTVSGKKLDVPAKTTNTKKLTPQERNELDHKNRKKWQEAEDRVKLKENDIYKVTLCKLYVYEPHVTVLNQDHEVYGTMGIRVNKLLGGHKKKSPIASLENLPARSWSVSSGKPTTVQAYSGNIRTVSDPTGKKITYQGSINLGKSRSYKITDRYLEEGAQVNIQIKLSEADPGVDDNFPWKQRTLEIQKMKLGKEYLLIQSEEDEKRYTVAVSFKVEKL